MVLTVPRFAFHDLRPDRGDFLADLIAGLSQPQKTLPPKYFYDERGCALFEAICDLPEYYPTRTETAIMRAHGRDMARRLGPRCALIEYGSGNSRKTRILIGELAPVAYVPIDIAAAQLEASAAELARAFPDVAVIAVCADYSRPFALPDLDGVDAQRRVVYFPGSTIGNFTPPDASAFLENARTVAGAGSGLLIGVDLKKDPARLHAAYNDARGVTAQFNLNLLARINRELGANFDLAAFRHHAWYNVRWAASRCTWRPTATSKWRYAGTSSAFARASPSTPRIPTSTRLRNSRSSRAAPDMRRSSAGPMTSSSLRFTI